MHIYFYNEIARDFIRNHPLFRPEFVEFVSFDPMGVNPNLGEASAG